MNLVDIAGLFGFVYILFTNLISDAKQEKMFNIFLNFIKQHKNISIKQIANNITLKVLNSYNYFYGDKVNDSFFTKHALGISVFISTSVVIFTLYSVGFFKFNYTSVSYIFLTINILLIFYYILNDKTKHSYLNLAYIFSLLTVGFLSILMTEQLYKIDNFLSIFLTVFIGFAIIAIYKLNTIDSIKYFIFYFVLVGLEYYSMIYLKAISGLPTEYFFIPSCFIIYFLLKNKTKFIKIFSISTIMFLFIYATIYSFQSDSDVLLEVTVISYYLIFLLSFLLWIFSDFISINISRTLFESIIKNPVLNNLLKLIIFDLILALLIFIIPAIIMFLLKYLPVLFPSFIINFSAKMDDFIVFQLLNYEIYIKDFVYSLIFTDSVKWNNILIINVYILLPTLVHIVMVIIYILFTILNATLNTLLNFMDEYFGIHLKGKTKFTTLLSLIITLFIYLLKA